MAPYFRNQLCRRLAGSYDGIRQLHDSIFNLLSRGLKRAHAPHEGGAWGNSQPWKDTFTAQVNRLSENDSKNDRWLQRIIPDLILSALHLEHLENRAYGRFGDATNLGDVRTVALGQVNSKPVSMAFGASAQKRAGKVNEAYQKFAKKLDAKLGTHTDATRPAETEMNSCNSWRVSGFVVGAFGKVSMQVRDLADLVACELNAEHLALFDGAMNESKQMFTQRIRRSIGLAVHRGWAKLLLGRFRTLFKTHGSRAATHARQMRTTPRKTNSFIFTRLAAGVATTTPARSRRLVD